MSMQVVPIGIVHHNAAVMNMQPTI